MQPSNQTASNQQNRKFHKPKNPIEHNNQSKPVRHIWKSISSQRQLHILGERKRERERDAYITYHEMSEIDYGPSHTRRAAKNWEHKEPREKEDENIGGPNPRVHEPLCVPIQIRRWHSFHIQARHSQIPVYGFWFGDPWWKNLKSLVGFDWDELEFVYWIVIW